MKLAVFNNKGGVGKTTISIILTQIALKKGLKVLGIDQDEQANYSTSMRYLKAKPDYRDLFRLETVINDKVLAYKYDVMIVDCPPGINDRSRSAITNADIVIIPVRPDLYSFMHISKILQKSGDKHYRQIPLVKVGFSDGGIASRKINDEILTKGYRVIGDLPIHKAINDNLSMGEAKWWFKGMTEASRKPFELMYTRLNLLYAEITAIREKKAEEKRNQDNENIKPDYYDNPENPDIQMLGVKKG